MSRPPQALPQFSDTLYASLCQIAEAALRASPETVILPAELVHECYLKLSQSSTRAPTDRVEFRALTARMMRQALVDRVRRRRAQKRGEGWARVALPVDDLVSSGGLSFDLLVLDEALRELGELDERQAQVIELRFFGGLTLPEIAQALRIGTRTAEEDWRLARAWLRRALD